MKMPIVVCLIIIMCGHMYGQTTVKRIPTWQEIEEHPDYKALSKTDQDDFRRDFFVKYHPTAVIFSNVLLAKKKVNPSMIPPQVLDKLHSLEEVERLFVRDMETTWNRQTETGINLGSAYVDGYREGQIHAIRDLLLIINILDAEGLSYINNELLALLRPDGALDDFLLFAGSKELIPSRLRALAAVLLISNYKELEPVAPDNIVQEAIPER